MIFSPSLEMVFADTELAFEERMRLIRRLGFGAFEFWGWWNKDIGAIDRERRRLGLEIASFCTRMIPLTDPARRAEFVDGLRESLEAAARLECRTLIAQTGPERGDMDRAEQRRSVIDGLRACVPHLEAAGVQLVVEPLNTRIDHPGYFLTTTREACDILEQVGSPSVKLLFDVYHQHITEGNLISNLTDNIGKIGYLHIADHPGRHEPGTGEIHYGGVLEAIRLAGYRGYVGLEFRPTGHPADALAPYADRTATGKERQADANAI
ncbi:hydroxypyruvate isomerase family protein [Paenibacillus thermoaerophilus]|uniref:Hydroxypyruvate isomerase family protein n=1 Tax=Paenibacillus thermoaerophilus TaxID=1215385 RepID=A0ABW2V739_9BACL|nr:TIM barrel protein [Paenibacillus thermoaerophilus]